MYSLLYLYIYIYRERERERVERVMYITFLGVAPWIQEWLKSIGFAKVAEAARPSTWAV